MGFYNSSFEIKNRMNKIHIKSLIVNIDKYEKYDRIIVQAREGSLKNEQ